MKQKLVERGVSPVELKAEIVGTEDPVINHSGESAWRFNREVEFVAYR